MNDSIIHNIKNYIIVDIFIIINLFFLSIDIFFAHSINNFSKPIESVPLYFSLVSSFFLSLELWKNYINNNRNKIISIIIGFISIIIGVTGTFYHLHNSFFKFFTLKSLVYTAPFVAPLAYSGLGFLILINSKVKPDSIKWNKYLIFIGLGGFIGNYILSLCDHAQNGFFINYEWIPVISSSFAISFLSIFIIKKEINDFINLAIGIMIIQIFVGMWGFYFHVNAILDSKTAIFFEKIIYSAPIFAPLLFINLSLLCIIALVDLKFKKPLL